MRYLVSESIFLISLQKVLNRRYFTEKTVNPSFSNPGLDEGDRTVDVGEGEWDLWRSEKWFEESNDHLLVIVNYANNSMPSKTNSIPRSLG